MTSRIPSPSSELPTDPRSIIGSFPGQEEPDMVPLPEFEGAAPDAPGDGRAPRVDGPASSGDGQDVQAEIEGYLSQLGEAAKVLAESFSQALEHLNSIVVFIPPEVVARIQALLNKIQEWLKRIFELIEEVFSRYAPFVAIIVRAFEWVRDVEAPMRSLAKYEFRDESENMAYWEGKAQQVYAKKKTTQAEAVIDIADAAKFINGWLISAAKENVEWLSRLLQLELDLNVKALQLILAARGKDAEAAVKMALELIEMLIQEGGTEIIGALNRLMDSVADKNEVMGHLAGMGMAGDWPQAVEG